MLFCNLGLQITKRVSLIHQRSGKLNAQIGPIYLPIIYLLSLYVSINIHLLLHRKFPQNLMAYSEQSLFHFFKIDQKFRSA